MLICTPGFLMSALGILVSPAMAIVAQTLPRPWTDFLTSPSRPSPNLKEEGEKITQDPVQNMKSVSVCGLDCMKDRKPTRKRSGRKTLFGCSMIQWFSQIKDRSKRLFSRFAGLQCWVSKYKCGLE